MLVSIVVPAFNEANGLAHLYGEISAVCANLVPNWELVIVDDGSTDTTWSQIEALSRLDCCVRGVRLSRNFGHQYALLAGLASSGGDAVISMDADMQHPPSVIPQLIEAWQNGNKIVKTVRKDSNNVSFFKRVSSRLYYRFFSYLSGVQLAAGMADFRLLDRKVLVDILQFQEESLFLRGIVQWVGYPTATISYECGNRGYGASKYPLLKMLRLGWHGISSFSVIPLRLGVLVGFIVSGMSFAGILYAIYGKFIEGKAVPGWASTMVLMSFLFGVLFVFLGVLGEYIGRILMEVKQRPRYLVSERIGFSRAEDKRVQPGYKRGCEPTD